MQDYTILGLDVAQHPRGSTIFPGCDLDRVSRNHDHQDVRTPVELAASVGVRPSHPVL